MRRLTPDSRPVYFDLIGLPPTPEEVDVCVKDAAPDAFSESRHRLLASPRFGERACRHWLDVARYAEFVGQGKPTSPIRTRANAIMYRSFNADKPYDQFIREQIAL